MRMNKSNDIFPPRPSWFAVAIDDEDVAVVTWIGDWAKSHFNDLPSSHRVFGPGENPLYWARAWEEENGRKIARWEASEWRPTQFPVFKPFDENLVWNDVEIVE